MWLLGRLLPIMVGDLVPEDDNHWQCYIDLLRIMSIVTAVEVTENSINILTMLIECYLSTFNALFPDSITPKMHYLLHLPDQIKKYVIRVIKLKCKGVASEWVAWVLDQQD